MKKYKFKAWVVMLFLSTAMSLMSIVLWLIMGTHQLTLSLLISMIALVLCGIGFSLGLKLGFKYEPK